MSEKINLTKLREIQIQDLTMYEHTGSPIYMHPKLWETLINALEEAVELIKDYREPESSPYHVIDQQADKWLSQFEETE